MRQLKSETEDKAYKLCQEKQRQIPINYNEDTVIITEYPIYFFGVISNRDQFRSL